MARRSIVAGLLALAVAACSGRDLYDPVDSPFRDSAPADGDDDADADDADDADADDALPLECGYPSSSYGYREGRVVEPFPVWSCAAEETSLPRLWCGHGATILHVVVAWCGICEASTQDLLVGPLAELEGEDVAFVELLVEDEGHGEVAEQDTCEWWEDRFGGAVSPFIPVDGETTSALWGLASADVVPLTVVIDRRGVIRVWSALDVPPDLADWVRSLLDES